MLSIHPCCQTPNRYIHSKDIKAKESRHNPQGGRKASEQARCKEERGRGKGVGGGVSHHMDHITKSSQ